LHADYTWKLTETKRLKFGIDMFNIANRVFPYYVNQFEEVNNSPGLHNPDFLQPEYAGFGASSGYSAPFSARLMARFEF